MAAPRKRKKTPQKRSSQGEKVDVRALCLEVLAEFEQRDAYVNLILNQRIFDHSLSHNERGFLTELVRGVLQRLNTIDWALSLYLNRPLEKLTPWIRNILRMGAYQLLYLDYVPDAAAVDESVKLAHRYGHKGVSSLVNAVLRKISIEKDNIPWPSPEEGEDYLSIIYSHPRWVINRWLKNLGWEETEALCRANNTPSPFTVRVNTLRFTREDLKETLKEEGIEASECRFSPWGLELGGLPRRLTEINSFQRGLFQIQGEASMLVAPALNPQPGEDVLDLCSAPGGKTIHAAMLMENSGKIIAADLYPQRLKLVEKAAVQLGADIVRTISTDGRNLPLKMHSSFNRVLLDVPCSGLGVLRRKGDLKWRRRPEDISSLSELQLKLLKEAFSALCPGGVLLYSACTTEPEETVQVINAFLEEEPGAYLTPLSPFLPEALVSPEEEGMAYFWPHKHNLDGFFLARLRKNTG